MNFIPSSRAVTLLLLLAAGVALPQATSWKGMLLAKPALFTLSTDALRSGLTGFREVMVVVENLPDALRDSLTKEDIEGWTANRLKNMGVRVVSNEDQTKAYDTADHSTDEKALAANDRFRSHVYVNVNADRLPSGAIYANISLECKRGVFVHPGYFGVATVWDSRNLIYFGSGYDAREKLRDSLNILLDILETDWKKCNPSRSSAIAVRLGSGKHGNDRYPQGTRRPRSQNRQSRATGGGWPGLTPEQTGTLSGL